MVDYGNYSRLFYVCYYKLKQTVSIPVNHVALHIINLKHPRSLSENGGGLMGVSGWMEVMMLMSVGSPHTVLSP